jgi:hypothetical protein
MNELQARKLMLDAVGGTGKISNEKTYWTAVLTALNGSFSSANNEHEFWRKFASHLSDKLAPLPATQTVIENGDVLPGTGGDFTVVVAGGVVTGGTWAAD